MKFSATKPRAVLLAAVLVAVICALILLPNDRTYAQSETEAASARAIPALTAQATESGIVLRWEAAPGAVRYDLRTWWASDAGWQDIGGGNLTGTSYTHADVTAGTTYHYTIRAIYADGEGPWLSSDYPTAVPLAVTRSGTATPLATVTSAPASGPTSTATSTPTPPATATASASGLAIPALTARATESGIVLRWEAAPGAVRYELLTWWASAPGWQAIGGGALTGTSYTHAEVRAGTTYYYSIRALNAAGEASPWLTGDYPTATALASRGDATSTATPTSTPGSGPTATPAATAAALSAPRPTARAGPGEIRVTWGAVANAAGYHVIVWDRAINDWVRIGGDLRVRSYLHRGLAAGVTYYFHVRAAAADGAVGPWSALVSAVPFAGGTVTPTPTPTPSITPTVATTQRGALIALYEATDGDNWIRNDNWLTDAPLDSWYGVTAEGRAYDVTILHLWGNNLKGTLPDLSALTDLKTLSLEHNRLHGPIPDLRALAELSTLVLRDNELSGPFPDLSVLPKLRRIVLRNNRMSGPVFDTHRLTNLWLLDLENNELSGPLPDVDAFVDLRVLNLDGNRFCLPAGASLSHAVSDVDVYLKSLDLPECTEADYAAFPAAPANLTAAVGSGQVTLSWDAVSDAASYDLWVWDSLDRTWGPVGGSLNGTRYTHPVLTDGRNYYFQVRSRDAAGVRGPWSERAQAIVVAQRFPPPPASLKLNIFYQKYLKAGGVIVTAPSEISDAKMEQVRAIVTGMYAGRPAYFEELSDNLIRIILFKYGEQGQGLSQLPERGYVPYYQGGAAFAPFSGRQVAAAWDSDEHCYLVIHEFAHAIHSAIMDAPGGQAFDARLNALYAAAMDAGLWRNSYASRNAREYWAQTVTYWFWEYMRSPPEERGRKVADYDPEMARFITETFDEGAYVPDFCKP